MKSFTDLIAEQITFWDERFYSVGDKFYPSVTTILDAYPKGAGFNQWLIDMGDNSKKVMERAGDIGSKIHDAIHRMIKGEEIELDEKFYNEEEWKYLCRFIEFWKRYSPKVIQTEISLINERLGYAGTLDLIAEIEGQTWLIDFKTSNAIYNSYELQVAAYRALWRENDTMSLVDGSLDLLNNIKSKDIDKAGIFWFKAKTRGEDKKKLNIQGEGWQVKEYTRDWLQSLDLFNATQKLWKNENPNPKPKNRVYPLKLKI